MDPKMDNSVNQYTTGEYLAKNPDWGQTDSNWKAENVAAIIKRNHLQPQLIVDVGCGAGAVIHALAKGLELTNTQLEGYDVSPQAIELARKYEAPNVRFTCEDFLNASERADLVLLLDVFEHVPDYMGFLEALKPRGDQFIFHIPLDMNVQAVFRDAQIELRDWVGHVHYFSKKTALRTLEDCGFKIIDLMYTRSALDLEPLSRSASKIRTKVANVLRRLTFPVAPDFAAKLYGGYSLMVLAM